MTQRIETSKLHFLHWTQGTLVKLERNRNNPNASNAIRTLGSYMDAQRCHPGLRITQSVEKKTLAKDQACRSHQSAGTIPPGARTNLSQRSIGTYKMIQCNYSIYLVCARWNTVQYGKRVVGINSISCANKRSSIIAHRHGSQIASQWPQVSFWSVAASAFQSFPLCFEFLARTSSKLRTPWSFLWGRKVSHFPPRLHFFTSFYTVHTGYLARPSDQLSAYHSLFRLSPSSLAVSTGKSNCQGLCSWTSV